MTKNNKVCHLSSVHTVFDIRIFTKECTTLADAGFDVIYVVPHDKDEIKNKIKIIHIEKVKGSRYKRMTGIVWKVYKAALSVKADIYHFHDPELIPIGLLLKIKGKKVIYDVHEDLPRDILDKEWIGNIFLKMLFSWAASFMEWMGNIFFDGIITVTPTIAKRFSTSKTIIIRNLPVVTDIDSIHPKSIEKNNFSVVYTGGLTRIRGIKQLIDAMQYTEKTELWLLGEWETELYRSECETSNGWAKTKYFGNLTQNEAFAYTKSADAGVVNFLPVPNHITSMPNKAFEYMASSLPIIMSDFEYWKNIFATCALFANPSDSKDIAEKINLLRNNSILKERLGKEGRKIIDNDYSWESEKIKLIQYYEKILNN